MDSNEKAFELLARAERLGLRVEFDSGLTLLRPTKLSDPEVIGSIAEELAKHLPAVRSLSQKRAIAELGKKLKGSRIWSKEDGAGTLVGAEDGTLTLSISRERRARHEEYSRTDQISISSPPELVLILVEDDATDPAVAEPAPETPKKRLFGLI